MSARECRRRAQSGRRIDITTRTCQTYNSTAHFESTPNDTIQSIHFFRIHPIHPIELSNRPDNHCDRPNRSITRTHARILPTDTSRVARQPCVCSHHDIATSSVFGQVGETFAADRLTCEHRRSRNTRRVLSAKGHTRRCPTHIIRDKREEIRGVTSGGIDRGRPAS